MSKSKATQLLFCFMILGLWRGVVSDVKSKSSDKEEAKILELTRPGFKIKVTNWGASLMAFIFQGLYGRELDVVLGYDKIEEYKTDTVYFGATVGRVANRIGGAKFTLNGTEYKLSANEKKNTLHGGFKGFSDVVWKVDKYKPDDDTPSVTFSYHSRDGEEGFPGDLKAKVTYSLVEYGLSIKMKAEALNKATPVNLAHHTYWNLGGHDSGDILSNQIQIVGSHITPVDKDLIPTGKLESVKGTPFDFTTPAAIDSKIKNLPSAYDINYALIESPKKLRPAAVVHSPKTRLVMQLFTNQPGLQFYTGNYIKDVKGKNGVVYKAHAGLCLETQGFPDAVNHPNFPSQIITPGNKYAHEMLFKFAVMDSGSGPGEKAEEAVKAEKASQIRVPGSTPGGKADDVKTEKTEYFFKGSGSSPGLKAEEAVKAEKSKGSEL